MIDQRKKIINEEGVIKKRSVRQDWSFMEALNPILEGS